MALLVMEKFEMSFYVVKHKVSSVWVCPYGTTGVTIGTDGITNGT